MSSEKDKDEIRIIDKRRFTSEGDTKAETASGSEENRAYDAPKAESAKTQVEIREETEPPPASQGGVGEERSREPVDHTDFSSFLISMATQALMMLGQIPDPETNQRHFHLEAARQTIDMIAVLEEKTKGNLTKDEERLLTEILASLRLAYVKTSREKGHVK